MKKGLLSILMLALCLMCAGCGGKNPSAKGANGEVVTELEAPMQVQILDTEEGLTLSWDAVENAAGYRVYCGSSRLSNDFAEVTTKALKETTYAVETKDYKYYKVISVNGDVESDGSEAVSLENTIFGKNTRIYSPLDDPEAVNMELMKIFNRQETAQFDKYRYAIMFKPGGYSEEIEVKIGFYMDVFGLGMLPTDTVLQNFNCPATWLGDASNHNATCNFWRGVSNLKINDSVMWAVSQATFMRRMYIDGNMALHDNYGWSSGGFLSDSVVTKVVDSGSQQQWLSRNCDWSSWTGENWNIVFAGIEEGKAPVKTWPAAAYTAVDEVTAIKEKPFLVYQNDSYGVFVPGLRENSKGVSWVTESGEFAAGEGSLVSLDEFYVANAETDTAATINAALSQGKNLLLTPGIYSLDEAIVVENPNTIVLGIGYATLQPTNGNLCMEVADAEGIEVAGILFDAGTTKSETLLRVGRDAKSSNSVKNPILLADLFFRVGGATREKTAVDSCVIINANSVIGDNFWVWRADHGDGVAWDANTAPNGIIVNGDDVTIYALMVEHFQEYQTVWNGNNGKVIFYQSELPYDVPKQSEWCSHDGKLHGFASYYVSDEVTTHTAYGIGIYSYNRDAIVEEYCAMEVPDVDGMDLHNVCSVMITGYPGVSHVINNYGSPAYKAGTRSIITDFREERKKALETQQE